VLPTPLWGSFPCFPFYPGSTEKEGGFKFMVMPFPLFIFFPKFLAFEPFKRIYSLYSYYRPQCVYNVEIKCNNTKFHQRVHLHQNTHCVTQYTRTQCVENIRQTGSHSYLPRIRHSSGSRFLYSVYAADSDRRKVDFPDRVV
jgi:hypothetical protein